MKENTGFTGENNLEVESLSGEELKLKSTTLDLLRVLLENNHYSRGNHEYQLLVHVTKEELAEHGTYNPKAGFVSAATMFKADDDGLIKVFGGPDIEVDAIDFNLQDIGKATKIVISAHTEPNHSDSEPNFFGHLLDLRNEPNFIESEKRSLIDAEMTEDEKDEYLEELDQASIVSITITPDKITAQTSMGFDIDRLSPESLSQLEEKISALTANISEAFSSNKEFRKLPTDK